MNLHINLPELARAFLESVAADWQAVRFSLWIAGPALLLGAVAWTLLEYILHRWFHEARGSNHASREHLAHHARPDYFSPGIQKAAVWATIASVSLVSAYLLLGAQFSMAFTLGLSTGYIVYEWLHRLAHVIAPLTTYGANVRARHFHHHFVAPHMNHGVSTALWDHVFGTYAAPHQVPVPKKHAHALAWVLGADGDIAPEFRAAYKLVR